MKALREQNIVHRDLKPGNILIKKDPVAGRMKVSSYEWNTSKQDTFYLLIGTLQLSAR